MKKIKKYFIFSILLCIMSIFVGCSCEKEVKPSTVYNNIRKAVFKVEATKNGNVSISSGFFIDSFGTAVVNYHDIADYDSLKVVLWSGTEITNLEITGYDVSSNLAVIKVNSDSNEKVKFLSTTGIMDKTYIGEKVYTLGYEQGNSRITFNSGIITNNLAVYEGVNYYQTSSGLVNGSYGAVTVTENGVAIGISTILSNDCKDYVIPVNKINTIKNNKIDHVGEEENKEYKTIQYGVFPQTRVTDVNLIQQLDHIEGELDPSGYYVKNLYGNLYVYMQANEFSNVKFVNEEAIVEGDSYYFEMNSINWIVLKETSTSYVLMAENVLFASQYSTQNEISYDSSIIRSFLNTNFVRFAFTEEEKNNILPVNALGDKTDFTSGEDYVSILSYQDAIDSSLGFTESYQKYDTMRNARVSDFALITGAGISQYGFSSWALRTAYPYYSNYNYRVEYQTIGVHAYPASSSHNGIRPVIVLQK